MIVGNFVGNYFQETSDKGLKSLILLAGASGFEPETYGFGDRRSTN